MLTISFTFKWRNHTVHSFQESGITYKQWKTQVSGYRWRCIKVRIWDIEIGEKHEFCYLRSMICCENGGAEVGPDRRINLAEIINLVQLMRFKKQRVFQEKQKRIYLIQSWRMSSYVKWKGGLRANCTLQNYNLLLMDAFGFYVTFWSLTI